MLDRRQTINLLGALVCFGMFGYAIFAEKVLHYVPCFCGCQRSGHRDNDDCFIQGREPDGRPIWDPHGMT